VLQGSKDKQLMKSAQAVRRNQFLKQKALNFALTPRPLLSYQSQNPVCWLVFLLRDHLQWESLAFITAQGKILKKHYLCKKVKLGNSLPERGGSKKGRPPKSSSPGAGLPLELSSK
jgi:hypothetical protein